MRDDNQDALSENEIARIEARCNATSPGPWVSYVEGRDHTSGSSFIQTGASQQRGQDIELIGATAEDQDFIAGARQDIPRLIAEIRRLRRLLERSSP
jgi:hypothetical protein